MQPGGISTNATDYSPVLLHNLVDAEEGTSTVCPGQSSPHIETPRTLRRSAFPSDDPVQASSPLDVQRREWHRRNHKTTPKRKPQQLRREAGAFSRCQCSWTVRHRPVNPAGPGSMGRRNIVLASLGHFNNEEAFAAARCLRLHPQDLPWPHRWPMSVTPTSEATGALMQERYRCTTTLSTQLRKTFGPS